MLRFRPDNLWGNDKREGGTVTTGIRTSLVGRVEVYDAFVDKTFAMLGDEDLWSVDTVWILTMQFLGRVRTRARSLEAVAQLEHVGVLLRILLVELVPFFV